ncbi:MAG: hypothetical protein V3V28_11835 [Polaribacter sp.]|uniref:hypothetical protein n=1 Tax=Polaribacter sp. TaxID=1920175 RepID=UPI002F36107C
MKLNIKKFFGLLALATLLYACDTTNESGYIPAVYESPTTFTITEDATASADNSFVVTYSPSSKGEGYYAVVPSGTAAPSSTAVHTGNGFQQAGNFSVDGSTPVAITVDNKIYGAYTYDVYAIHKSADNFISETVTKLTVTTPDTADPVFLRDDAATAPAHNVQPGANSPFRALNLVFSEPVFYQGGDVTFEGFFGGRIINVNGAVNFVTSGTSIVINDHGTFAPDDAILVTWGPGTFKDKSGKDVAPLTGFGYYFWTRAFTIAEQAKLMPGQYDYSTVWYGGLSGFYSGLFTGNPGVFLPDTGTYEITADASDATGHTLSGINLFSGFLGGFGLPEPQTLPIYIDPATDGALGEYPSPVSSVITAGQPTSWSHYEGFFGPNPGFYNFGTGNITHYLSLVGDTSGTAIDDIDYIYTRIGTYARSRDAKSMSMDDAIKLSKATKKITKRNFNGTIGY